MPQSPGLQAPASSPGSFIPQLSLNTTSGKPSLDSQTDSKAPPMSHPAPQASPTLLHTLALLPQWSASPQALGEVMS